jgi:NAD(P)-dependent dehydrogenase (short-subunit alcohol dehydrogenase family)
MQINGPPVAGMTPIACGTRGVAANKRPDFKGFAIVHCRIANLSSGLAQFAEMAGGAPAYRISKTALNAVTRIAAEARDSNILVNSACPG